MSNDDQSRDFAALFEAQMAQVRTDFQVGDQLSGTVTAVDRGSIFVDVGGRSDGVLDVAEFLGEDGELTIAEGDVVSAYFVGTDDDTIRLTTRMSGSVADASLADAHQAGIPMEGRVMSERKGGYEVRIAGHDAFCPYSQIDLHRREPEDYIGGTFAFLISEYSEKGRNLIVSRRRLLERERAQKREELQARLQPEDTVSGTVTRLMPFGAFVDLGGAEGLIHVSEMGWGRTTRPEDVLSPGQEVEVQVLALDWGNERISLSLRHARGDPWDTLDASEDIREGHRVVGTVSQLAPFGAFVELIPGIEGLVHVSNMGAGRRINHPEEVVSVSERVEVSILDIDHERRRIALSMDDTIGGDVGDAAADARLAEGARMAGTVDGVRNFGVFVRLPTGDTGLVHISQVQLRGGGGNPGRELYRRFPPNSDIEVIVREIQGNRISLTLPETVERENERIDPDALKDDDNGQLGSLGDLLDGLDLS